MWSRGAITQPFDTFHAEPLDPFGNGLRRRVELVSRLGLAQPALDHASDHRLSTFGRQRRILVDVHLVSPWKTEASQPQLPRFRPDGQPSERPHLEHDPEKCVAVFRKDHAQTKSWNGMTIRRRVIPF